MKQPTNKKNSKKHQKHTSRTKPLKKLTGCTAQEIEHDLQQMRNLINVVVTSEKAHEKSTRSTRSRKPSNRPKKDQKSSTKTTKNHDNCDACGEEGQLVCCDGCPNAFHFICLETPILNVEDLGDSWYCPDCEYKRNMGKKTRNTITTTIAATGGTLFKDLIDDIDRTNPKAFRLPKEVYDIFEGVASDKFGLYVDTSTIKRVKYKKNGEPILPDYHPSKDDNGEYIVCYKCRKTARVQAIIHCDYCPLYWHLDCLDPPLTIPPNLAKKWRCPLHIEHVIKPPRKRKDRASDSSEIAPLAPACAYQNYIPQIIDGAPLKKKQKNNFEQAITSNHGVVYQLPEPVFTLPFGTHRTLQPHYSNAPQPLDRRTSIPSTLASSSSKSEANTPPTMHTSPVSSHKAISREKRPRQDHSKEEIEAWLHTMAGRR